MARKLDPVKIERARLLQTAGLSFEEIATKLSVRKETVERWLIPGRAERQRLLRKAIAYLSDG